MNSWIRAKSDFIRAYTPKSLLVNHIHGGSKKRIIWTKVPRKAGGFEIYKPNKNPFQSGVTHHGLHISISGKRRKAYPRGMHLTSMHPPYHFYMKRNSIHQNI